MTYNDVRHGADRLLGRILIPTRSIPRSWTVVREISGEYARVGRKGEILS
jgi:hypothetical protein